MPGIGPYAASPRRYGARTRQIVRRTPGALFRRLARPLDKHGCRLRQRIQSRTLVIRPTARPRRRRDLSCRYRCKLVHGGATRQTGLLRCNAPTIATKGVPAWSPHHLVIADPVLVISDSQVMARLEEGLTGFVGSDIGAASSSMSRRSPSI
jgi:hypothetical protein